MSRLANERRGPDPLSRHLRKQLHAISGSGSAVISNERLPFPKLCASPATAQCFLPHTFLGVDASMELLEQLAARSKILIFPNRVEEERCV